MDTTKLDDFLQKIGDLAARVHKLPRDDVRYQYRIVENHVILAVDCPQRIAITTVAWNFAEHLKDYVPDARPDFVNLLDRQVCHDAEVTSLFAIKHDIDVHRTVDTWDVFGEKRFLTVRTINPFLGAGIDKYADKLKTAGYDPATNAKDYDTFERAYETVVGTKPLETLVAALRVQED